MVAALVGGGKYGRVGSYDVVFEFAHCLECQACGACEFGACLVEGIFRRAFKMVPVLVEE